MVCTATFRRKQRACLRLVPVGVAKLLEQQLTRFCLVCVPQVLFEEASFIEEFHALALALNGRFSQRPLRFSDKCPAQVLGSSASGGGGSASQQGGGAGPGAKSAGDARKSASPPPRGYNSFMIGREQVAGVATGTATAAGAGGGGGGETLHAL